MANLPDNPINDHLAIHFIRQVIGELLDNAYASLAKGETSDQFKPRVFATLAEIKRILDKTDSEL
jgi:hypothetical protein